MLFNPPGLFPEMFRLSGWRRKKRRRRQQRGGGAGSQSPLTQRNWQCNCHGTMCKCTDEPSNRPKQDTSSDWCAVRRRHHTRVTLPPNPPPPPRPNTWPSEQELKKHLAKAMEKTGAAPKAEDLVEMASSDLHKLLVCRVPRALAERIERVSPQLLSVNPACANTGMELGPWQDQPVHGEEGAQISGAAFI